MQFMLTRPLLILAQISGAQALIAVAPEDSARLEVEPGVLVDDPCLAPSFDQPGCSAGPPSTSIDRRASASAALLPWDPPVPVPEPEPLLAFDKAVLEASVEVTFTCAPGGCPPGATAGAE